jgi:D-3-phosphoglycerate dehydrogenase
MNILTTTSSFSAEGFDECLNVIHNPYGRRLTESEVTGLIKEYQPVGIIAGIEPLTRQVFENATNLRVISRCGIGLDSVDLAAADDMGISVLNTPDAPTEAVAELALGMILSVLRNIPLLDRNVRNNSWKGPNGLLLKGKTVGIIGCGRIGSRLAELIKPFGCVMRGFDPAVQSHDLIEMVSLDDLLVSSDIISLHIPLNPNTRNILSAERIKILKKDTVLINVSRGNLIDEMALYEALKTGRLYGAALDCFADEPYKGPLMDLENVVLSPHMGSSTIETREIMERNAVDNLMSELKRLKLI